MTAETTALSTTRVPPRRAPIDLLAPLAVPAYALFWLSSLCAWGAGDFRNIAFVSVALDLTGRPSGLANLQTVGAFANVLMVLFGGLASDRFRPHRVVLAAIALQTGITAALALAGLLGQLASWHLIAVSVVSGAAGGLTAGSMFSVVPDLLPAERVRSANALSSITENLSRFTMPPLAGLAVAAAGAPPALAVATAISAAAVVLLGFVRPTPRLAADSIGNSSDLAESAARRSPIALLWDGVRTAQTDGAVWALIWVGAIVVPPSAITNIVGLPSLAKLSLAAGDAGVGFLFGALGAGSLVGAGAAGTLRAVHRPGIAVGAAAVIEGVLLVCVGLAPTLWLAAAAMVLVGFVQASRFVFAVTILQTRTPANVRGRVTALATFTAIAPQVPAIALAGYLGDTIGPGGLIVICGLLVSLGGAVLLSRRALRVLTA
jgi:MFS family permease